MVPSLEDADAYDNLLSGMNIGGVPYVDVASVDESWVIVRLTAAQGQLPMPPAALLTDPQVAVFRDWIAGGAER